MTDSDNKTEYVVIITLSPEVRAKMTSSGKTITTIMKRFLQWPLLLALAPVLAITGCNDDNPWSGSDQMGGIALNLESDGRLMHNTRADDTMCPFVPDVNEFGVSLTKSDNSYSKNWDSFDAFDQEKEFPIGDYTIEAKYGDLATQGFEYPCFKGSNTVHVSPGATTPVTVAATLANAMVSVRYTDAFTAIYPNHSAAIKTAGHDERVIFAKDETRPAFIDPSGNEDVRLEVTFANDQGKTVTVEPAKFKASPRHHYVITVNATGNVTKGDMELDIQFSEEVATETIKITLGDDLFDSPAPEVRATNFTSGTPIEMMEYDELAVSPQFDIYSFAGFQEVTLDVATEEGTYEPSFGKSVELVGASESVQALLANEGVKVSGIFKNPGKMAVVNVKDFLGKLPAGKYSVQVTAKDAMGRISTETVSDTSNGPITLKANVAKTEYTIKSAGNIDYMAEELSVVVNTNSEQLKNRIKFSIGNKNLEIKSVAASASAGAPYPYTYTYVLPIPSATTETVQIESNYGKMKITAPVSVNGPAYSVTVDAFAKFVVFRIDTNDAEMKQFLTNNLDIFNGNAGVTPANVIRDEANGMIRIKGLSANNQYDAYRLKINGSFEKTIPAFTTEAAADVPNGNFSENGDRVYFQNINTGGTFGTLSYQWHTTIDRFAPAGWTSLNAKTAYSGSKPLNTWFVVPSTYLDNGVCIIRTVGYSHNGTLPERDRDHQTYSGKYPGDLNISEGVLFLGEYSFDGTEHRSNGVAFNSRPMTLTFEYKYAPRKDHQAQADIHVYDASGAVIAEKIEYLSASSDMKSVTIRIPEYPFGKKAAKLYVRFRSMRDDTDLGPGLNIPSGSDLSISGYNGLNNNIPTNEYVAFAVGSVLTLDNVKLGYTDDVTVTAAPRRRK